MPKKSRIICKDVFFFQRKEVEITSLLMPISVGQDYHKGYVLQKTLALVFKKFPNLSHVNVAVADTVQRFSLAIKSSKKPEAMFRQAKLNGEIWVTNYKRVIKDNFKASNVNFYHWDEWLSHESYPKALQKIEELCKDRSSGLSIAIEKDIIDFENRYSKREGIQFFENEREYSRQCLKEECAVLLLWSECLSHSGPCGLFYPKQLINSIAFICDNYTNFIPMYAELNSWSNKDLNIEEIKISKCENDLTSQFSFLNTK